MHLVHPPTEPAANNPEYPVAEVDESIVSDVHACAANDCARTHGLRHTVDVNALVGRVVGHVMSKLESGPNVDMQLILAPGRHIVQSDPIALSFALSGILTAQLGSVDDPDEGGIVRVSTAADAHGVRVTISTDGIPPLGIIRAIAGDGDPLGDPTLAHCRRLIEEQGGSIRLVEQNQRIALRVAFPPVVPSNVVPLRRLAASSPLAARWVA